MNRPTILIIEDNNEILENICELLGLSGYNTLQANNGRDGIKIAVKKQPDLILCDISMPGMDGYEVLQEIRKLSVTSRIPVVFHTAKSEKADIAKGIYTGADAYLVKPYTTDALLRIVDSLIHKAVE